MLNMEKLKMRKIISKILGNTEQSYYRWKEEGRLIIKFLENFQKEELQEFIETGQIKMLEEFKQFKKIKANDPEYQMFKKFLKFQAFEEFQKTQNS